MPTNAPMRASAVVSIRTCGLPAPHCALRAAILCLAALSLHAGDDPKEIVRRALQINAHNSELERNYTYVQRDESRTVDSSGAVKRRESTTWDVTSSSRRMILRNDDPLTPKEQS